MNLLRSDFGGARRTRRNASRIRRRRLMACWPLGLMLMAGAAAPARAADWLGDTPLRGAFSGATTRWNGLYFGGTYGHNSMEANFTDAVSSLSGDGISLSNETAHQTSYGGFVGYNVTWDGQLVLGLEGDYHHMASDLTVSSSDQATSGSTTYDATSSVTLKDYGTIRGRAGYAVGKFLPYAQVGLAVGRLSYQTTGTSTSGGTTTTILNSGNTNSWRVGVSAGVGVDVALTSNVFLRGEYEYVAFGKAGGILDSLNTVRAGLGVKF